MQTVKVEISNSGNGKGNSGCTIIFIDNPHNQQVSIKGWVWDGDSTVKDFVPTSQPKKKGMRGLMNVVGAVTYLDIENHSNSNSNTNIHCTLESTANPNPNKIFKIDDYHMNQAGEFQNNQGTVPSNCVLIGM